MAERSTKKQQELLEYIDEFISTNGYGPTYREVMSALGYKSVSTVAVHVDGLIAKGYLRKRDKSARSLEVVTTRLSDAATPATPALLVELLDAEITQRLAHGDVEQLELLIEAAEVLGSTRVDAHKAALLDTQTT